MKYAPRMLSLRASSLVHKSLLTSSLNGTYAVEERVVQSQQRARIRGSVRGT